MSQIESHSAAGGVSVMTPSTGPGFAAGSRIQCRRGELLVDSLDEGEEVLTASGRWSRLTAIAQNTLPASVRIERDAFGPGQPYRPMSIGPGQIIAVDGQLAEAATFVNGTTVRSELPGRTRFFSISLDKPGFAIVDGIAAEMPQADGPSAVAASPVRRERLRSLVAI